MDKIKIMRRRVEIRRLDIKKVYKELFKKVDKIYSKRKKSKEDQENIKKVLSILPLP